LSEIPSVATDHTDASSSVDAREPVALRNCATALPDAVPKLIDGPIRRHAAFAVQRREDELMPSAGVVITILGNDHDRWQVQGDCEVQQARADIGALRVAAR
jgi:hypothetical protein